MPISWSYEDSVYDILSVIWVDNFFQAYKVIKFFHYIKLCVLKKVEEQKDMSHDRNINCLMLEPHMGK